MTNAIVHTRVRKVAAAGFTDTNDTLATEDPLEIRLVHGPSHNRRQQNISVTMRTPGNDMELAAGFLFTEGIISHSDDIQEVILSSTEDGDIATVHLKPSVNARLGQVQRNFAATAACGVCGKTNLSSIRTAVNVGEHTFTLSAPSLLRLPDLLRHQQSVFDSTGGLHAAALFNDSGQLLLLREDIGRHNAVDKVIGAAIQQSSLSLQQYGLLLSGRAGFELIQKAAMAHIPVIAAIGAPSSLAVKMAEQWHITLVGFLKEDRFNIYSGAATIDVPQNTTQHG
ncbi:formate dehydrogenase accessory sulfurtransferase FdhD [Chitinophaga polysaccharea]|uniref:formate dehydrogenase accessory sulfurtransferase FdhD n=1 Tax=Chitinophaga TaxID=79328 RepID=UPI001455412F|nr:MULTISPECIES: formate dehydrogenase accessory sulfurtransferase FdhD [Chitinophaga]NLR58031.1 formate dehydrogenase accessory sulfurtransferase FdhD [Chitinophaga polysaccharea]NLU93624.1 formate dehydrogenase accessory sulfurtransferase FdhD [Chitinophaga sp. Ak27]